MQLSSLTLWELLHGQKFYVTAAYWHTHQAAPASHNPSSCLQDITAACSLPSGWPIPSHWSVSSPYPSLSSHIPVRVWQPLGISLFFTAGLSFNTYFTLSNAGSLSNLFILCFLSHLLLSFTQAKMVTSRLLPFLEQATLTSDLGSTIRYNVWKLLMVHTLLGLLASLTGLVEHMLYKS